MSSPRHRLNAAALLKLLGRVPPPAEVSQPLQVAALGSGGDARPIDWLSPDGDLRLRADATDARAYVILQDDCGAQVLIDVKADGSARVRVIGCDGVGYSLTPAGLAQVSVTDPGGEDEEETVTEAPASWIIITGCVDGVNKSVRVMGEVLE